MKSTGDCDLATVKSKVKPKVLDPKSYTGSAAGVRSFGDRKTDGYRLQTASLCA